MTAASLHSQRLGLVDVGSNAVRTRVVEVANDAVVMLHDERNAIRVGREVFVSGALTPATIAAVADALGRFRSICDRYGVACIRAVATSAARSASNGADLVAAARQAGVDLDVIDGHREAALLVTAVRQRVDLAHGRNVLVDLGAGSIEIVVLDAGTPISTASHPLGSLRVLDGMTPADQRALGADLIAAVDAEIERRAGPAQTQLHGLGCERLLAVGSGIDLIADFEAAAGRSAGRREGADVVPGAVVREWRARLAALPAAERTRQFGIASDRADLVVIALSIYAWLLRQLALDTVLVPRVSLRDGLLAEWLAAART